MIRCLLVGHDPLMWDEDAGRPVWRCPRCWASWPRPHAVGRGSPKATLLTASERVRRRYAEARRLVREAVR